MNPTDLMAQLTQAASELLEAQGIHPVLLYGWEDDNTHSAEYVGLAMWATNAPFEPGFASLDWNTPPPLPSKRETVLYRAAEDFFGTMEFARNTLSLAMYCIEHRNPENMVGEDEQFWERYATATVWLNIASDRLRDYFVIARFQITAKEYAKQHKKNARYAQPFHTQEADKPQAAHSTASKLTSIAERLGKLRKNRNQIVHELASQRGHNAVALINLQREEARGVPYAPHWSADAMQRSLDRNQPAMALSDMAISEIRDAFDLLKKWYMLLVKASALIFEYEYWKRIAR